MLLVGYNLLMLLIGLVLQLLRRNRTGPTPDEDPGESAVLKVHV
jgi:hypothetical protein